MVGCMLRVSSIHLRESTIAMLHDEAVYEEAQYPAGKEYKFLSVYHRGIDGFFIEIDSVKYHQSKSNCPDDLKMLIDFAITNGCPFVCVAEKEDTVSGLLKYD